MSIHFYKEDLEVPKFRRNVVKSWLNNAIICENKSLGDISFIFCSDDYLLKINKEFLDHDYYTDVITFDYVEGDLIFGDIFISIERVKENSVLFNSTFLDELYRIFIHGVLHLLGYKDKSDSDKVLMTNKEDHYLKILFNNL
jgi:probable rRNA maturation factor